MTMDDDTPPFSHMLRISELQSGAPTAFLLEPGREACAAIAADLGIDGVRKLRFEGKLAPLGKRDWRLTARLGATVTQACVVTLAPVTTRIDEDVERIWRADFTTAEPGTEIEMPEDTNEEPLREVIDLGAVMTEALALALPLYPRAEGAEIETANFAEPGVAPMTDDEAKPFAGLASLRDKLGKSGGESSD